MNAIEIISYIIALPLAIVLYSLIGKGVGLVENRIYALIDRRRNAPRHALRNAPRHAIAK